MCSNTVHQQRCVGRSTNLETQGAYSSLQSIRMFNTHRADVPQNARSSQIARGKVCTLCMWECLVIRTWQIPIPHRRSSGTTEMQCVAVCCGVLRCVAVCCSVYRWVAVCYRVSVSMWLRCTNLTSTRSPPTTAVTTPKLSNSCPRS